LLPFDQSPIASRYSLPFSSLPFHQSPIASRYSLPFSLLSFHHPSHS
jgi:hypothetical protein